MATVESFRLDLPLREARSAFERRYLELHLERQCGSVTRLSEVTGLERTNLYRKLKQLGIEVWRFEHADLDTASPQRLSGAGRANETDDDVLQSSTSSS